MDLLDFDAMKMKNTATSSISWMNHLPSLTKLFRWTELCLAVVLLSWIFNRLPFVLRISGDFFRQIAGVIACPLFVFLLCNAIIVTLIVKYERFSGEIPAADNAESLLYEELLKNHKISPSKQLSPENSSSSSSYSSSSSSSSSTPLPNEIEFQDKEIISQVNNPAVEEDDNVVAMEEKPSVLDSDSEDSDNPRVYRRWKSEKLELKDKKRMKLRRSETEKFMNRAKNRGENGCFLCPGEELSDEDFQRTVDDFIAKHLKFRRQESLDVVQTAKSELNFQN